MKVVIEKITKVNAFDESNESIKFQISFEKY